MTTRQELERYLKVWTMTRMHKALGIAEPTEDEKSASFLCSGFESKMDMLQNAEPTIFHSTMMDINYSGKLQEGFKNYIFEPYFNAREPEYTNADGLANAMDRAQIMAEAFIRDAAEAKKEARKRNSRELTMFFDCDNVQWDTAGPFGDGWESVVLFMKISIPFNYCVYE